jgi:hypothetical protein
MLAMGQPACYLLRDNSGSVWSFEDATCYRGGSNTEINNN